MKRTCGNCKHFVELPMVKLPNGRRLGLCLAPMEKVVSTRDVEISPFPEKLFVSRPPASAEVDFVYADTTIGRDWEVVYCYNFTPKNTDD